MHNLLQRINAFSPTIHAPRICSRSSMPCAPSITLTPRVSFTFNSGIPQSHSSSIVHRVVHFRYDGPIMRKRHMRICLFNMIKVGACKKEAGMREDTPSTSPTSLALNTSRALALAAVAGERSTEGSETASGVSVDLGVDSAKRCHLRLVVKPTFNKFMNHLTLNTESAREWAELKSSSTSTTLQLEEFENQDLESGGKQRVCTKRALINKEEQDAQEGWMSFTEASTLEGPLALEETLRANTVDHKLIPKLPPDTKVPWPKCMWVLMTKETRHVKRRVADETCHDAVITDIPGAFASHVAQVRPRRSGPDSPTLPTAAPTPPELRQESARDRMVLTSARKTHSAHDKIPAGRKISDCQVHGVPSTTHSCTVERDLKIALAKREKNST